MANKWDNIFYIFIGFYVLVNVVSSFTVAHTIHYISLRSLSPIIIAFVSFLIYKLSYEYVSNKTGNVIRVILVIFSAILFVLSLVMLVMLVIHIQDYSIIKSLGGSL